MVKKILFTLFLFGILVFFSTSIIVQAAECDDKSGQEKVTCLENKVQDLKSQTKTLSSQISIMDSQIRLTEARIEANKREILDLNLDIDTATKKITILEDSLEKIVDRLLRRIVVTYQAGKVHPLEIFLSSRDASDLLTRLNYLRITQRRDTVLSHDVQQAKSDYANQKEIFEVKKKKIETLKKQLEAYTAQLNQEKTSKQQLLSETQGSEATYQNLLAQAKAQLAALANFAISRAGGVEILPHSDKSDDWGKYYNQRDANWGNNIIGQSGERTWEVGCLLTSYSMVVSHFGGSSNPGDVAGNSSNFWYGTAYFLKPGPSANGRSSEAKNNPSLQELRDALNSGAAVIAGLSSDGGPYPQHYSDHWVVLRSVDGDSFRINDSWYQDAMNVSLSDHYSGWTIIEARIYR